MASKRSPCNSRRRRRAAVGVVHLADHRTAGGNLSREDKMNAKRHCTTGAVWTRRFLRWGLAAVLLMAGGCGDPKPVTVAPQAASPADAGGAYDVGPWAEVLRDNVRGGLVDYTHLATHAEPLDRYLAMIARTGPQSAPAQFTEPNAALAYDLNAYNACVLKAVLAADVPATMYDVRRPTLDHGYRFQVDGRTATLADLRAQARRDAGGDARIEFAMCAAAKGCPPLDAKPFRPDSLDDHLARLAQEAMDNPNMVRISHEDQHLLVALAIWTQREAFAAHYCRQTGSQSATMLNCLMHLASGTRRQYLVRASGYDVRVLPFDRALNAWSPSD